jgi:hypothetical protein
MRSLPLLLLSPAVLAIAGCPTRNKYDEPPAVRITSPATETTYTNGTVHITAALDPTLDLPIVLLENSTMLATLMPPAYSFDWATTGVSEGEHTVVAEVLLSSGLARSTPVTIVVDRTPPTVVTRAPAPGAKAIALRAPIQITFSEPILAPPPPAAAAALAILGGAAIPTRVTVETQGRTATVTIDDPAAVLPPVSLRGSISAAITDRAGNPLTLPSSDWSWDVPDFVKLPPVPLCSTLPPFNRLPVFAVGSNLRPVVARAIFGSVANIGCRLAVDEYDGSQWVATAALSADGDSANGDAALALAADDQPIVAWRPSTVPAPGEIDVAGWDGADWDLYAPVVPQPSSSLPAYPLLRVGSGGSPTLLWGNGPLPTGYFIARWMGSAWSRAFGTVPIVSQEPFPGPRFDMVLADDGNPIVSWVAQANRGNLSQWDGSTWRPAPEVSQVTEPFVAFDATRAPMIVSGGSGVFYVQHLVAGSWQPHQPTAGPPQTTHPRLAAGPDGLPVLAWYDAQTKSVGMGRWTGQRWDIRAFAFGINAVDEVPQLVVDRNGTAWVGWRDTTGQFNLWMANF